MPLARLVLVAQMALALAACPNPPPAQPCNGLGEACTLLCCAGLECRSTPGTTGVCTKSCRCAAGATSCNRDSIRDGCPPDAGLCVPTSGTGVGQCRAACDDATTCAPGEGSCTALAGAPQRVCVPDLGVGMDGAARD